MKKIAIIGGGIIGMTLANYLDTDKFDISLFDDEKNQATKASAGIDRKSTRLNSSHSAKSRMPSSA